MEVIARWEIKVRVKGFAGEKIYTSAQMQDSRPLHSDVQNEIFRVLERMKTREDIARHLPSLRITAKVSERYDLINTKIQLS